MIVRGVEVVGRLGVLAPAAVLSATTRKTARVGLILLETHISAHVNRMMKKARAVRKEKLVGGRMKRDETF